MSSPSGEDRVDGLGEVTLRSVRWLAAGRFVAEATALVSAIVIAHLVTPLEFGRAAVALAVAAIGTPGVIGFAGGIIHPETLGRDRVETTTLLSITLGAGLSAVTAVLARPVGGALFGSRTADLLELMSPIFLIASVGVVPQALLSRDLRFATVTIVDIASMVTGTATAISAAALGLRGTAIVLGALAAACVNSLLLIGSRELVLPRWHRHTVRAITGFGGPSGLSGVFYTVFQNIDYTIVAARLGPAQVGYYYRAYQLGVDYQSKISSIMLRVAFPLFSRMETLERVRATRRRIVRLHAIIIVPILGLYIALAPVLVPWVFGAPWAPAVLPSRILAFCGMLAAITTGLGPLMLAMGRPGLLLAWNVVISVCFAVIVFVTASFGIVEVAVGDAAFFVVVFVLQHRYLLGRVCGIRPRETLSELLPAFSATLALLATSLPTASLLDGLGAPAPVSIGVTALIGLTTAVLVLLCWFSEAWSELHLLVTSLIASRAGGVSTTLQGDGPPLSEGRRRPPGLAFEPASGDSAVTS